MSADLQKDAHMPMPLDLRLARHGIIVLLLGLLIGFVIPLFHNSHLGNAAHLVGLIGGFGMISLGTLWPGLRLGRSWSSAGVWTMVTSMYLNWVGLVLLGGFGSGPNAPSSTIQGSFLLWSRAGQVALTLGAFLTLFATLVALVGLRKLRVFSETPSVMPATVSTK